MANHPRLDIDGGQCSSLGLVTVKSLLPTDLEKCTKFSAMATSER